MLRGDDPRPLETLPGEMHPARRQRVSHFRSKLYEALNATVPGPETIGSWISAGISAAGDSRWEGDQRDRQEGQDRRAPVGTRRFAFDAEVAVG